MFGVLLGFLSGKSFSISRLMRSVSIKSVSVVIDSPSDLNSAVIFGPLG